MSNWDTIVYEVARGARVEGVGTGSTPPGNITTDVHRAIIDAMEYCKSIPTHFNIKTLTILVKSGVYSYELPSDFISIYSNVFYSQDITNDNSTGRFIMREMGFDKVEEMRLASDEYNTWDNSGRPLWYGIDISDSTFPNGDRKVNFVVSPIPNSDGACIQFRYISSLGIPKYIYGTGVIDSNGDAIAGTFTNGWLQHGKSLIREMALFYLWSGTMGGTEEANTAAGLHKANADLERSRIYSDTNRAVSPSQVRRYI